ncbi:hypothetical protein KIK06_27350 [Nocardiopsis sp. EMB25]|uniref:hypothetical protein n=1 Tax=Nocardiopsis sp. EMB25 TaxID=2835867 RepID=UPI002284AF46|nr:hypothetical protein [Nocardiopsis sp. EMB25]MCY9787601.1 hypothetical protein [Nocardiopsis sp. EMB25]
MTVTELENVNAFIIESGLEPGSTLRLGSDSASWGGGEPGVLVGLSLDPGGSGSMVRLPNSLPDAESIRMLADQLQEEVLESTHGDPVPTCPGHPHPAKPDVVDGVPSWVCPRDGRDIRPIIASESVA